MVCDLDRPEARLDRPVLTGCIIVRSDWAASVDQRRDLLAPAHSPAQVARDLRLPAHLGTTRRRSGGRAVSPPSCFVFRPSAPSGAAAPRVPPTGAAGRLPPPPPPPLDRWLITYLLIFFFLSFFVDVRRASPLPRASKRGGFDLQSVGYTMSGGCCCCCGGPI